ELPALGKQIIRSAKSGWALSEKNLRLISHGNHDYVSLEKIFRDFPEESRSFIFPRPSSRQTMSLNQWLAAESSAVPLCRSCRSQFRRGNTFALSRLISPDIAMVIICCFHAETFAESLSIQTDFLLLLPLKTDRILFDINSVFIQSSHNRTRCNFCN
ncbi:MAG: hypothetical protein JWQ21_1848, partial [Herminiimonas sp.]|nr:hypothetical protein [Herminiimonas sp.]